MVKIHCRNTMSFHKEVKKSNPGKESFCSCLLTAVSPYLSFSPFSETLAILNLTGLPRQPMSPDQRHICKHLTLTACREDDHRPPFPRPAGERTKGDRTAADLPANKAVSASRTSFQ